MGYKILVLLSSPTVPLVELVCFASFETSVRRKTNKLQTKSQTPYLSTRRPLKFPEETRVTCGSARLTPLVRDWRGWDQGVKGHRWGQN